MLHRQDPSNLWQLQGKTSCIGRAQGAHGVVEDKIRLGTDVFKGSF